VVGKVLSLCHEGRLGGASPLRLNRWPKHGSVQASHVSAASRRPPHRFQRAWTHDRYRTAPNLFDIDGILDKGLQQQVVRDSCCSSSQAVEVIYRKPATDRYNRPLQPTVTTDDCKDRDRYLVPQVARIVILGDIDFGHLPAMHFTEDLHDAAQALLGNREVGAYCLTRGWGPVYSARSTVAARAGDPTLLEAGTTASVATRSGVWKM
jgi:hypothetical protein